MSNIHYPVFYSFRRCPYAMRARMAIAAARQTVELREIVLRDKPQAMLDVSAKGTVPVLVLGKDKVIDESLDIMLWALSKSDPKHLLAYPKDEMLALIAKNDGEFKAALDRYKYPERFEGEDCSGARDKCLDFFETLNERLERRRYLFGDSISLADIAIFPFIRQCAHVDMAWFDGLSLSRLQQWLGEHKESLLFKAIMPKFDRWEEGDRPVIFSPFAG